MRTIWTGYISFGLVNIPVKLYSAVGGEEIDFDLLHEKDLSPIRYARFCKVEEKEVPYDEIVRGYEYEKGKYVVLSNEDFEKANVGMAKAITITDFVDKNEIGSIYFEKPYYIEADKGGEKPYALLRDALKNSGKVGIGKYVLRNREHLIMLMPDRDILILDQLRFPAEIKDREDIEKAEKIAFSKSEMEVALNLIEVLSSAFQPSKYQNTYKNELKRVISEKIAGKIPARKGKIPEPTRVPDLMAILKESLEKERKERSKAK